MTISRRDVLAAGMSPAIMAITSHPAARAQSQGQQMPADLIVRNAKVTTMQDRPSEAQAFVVSGERFVAVGDESQVMRWRGENTRVMPISRSSLPTISPCQWSKSAQSSRF
jgi:hypothetical protein